MGKGGRGGEGGGSGTGDAPTERDTETDTDHATNGLIFAPLLLCLLFARLCGTSTTDRLVRVAYVIHHRTTLVVRLVEQFVEHSPQNPQTAPQNKTADRFFQYADHEHQPQKAVLFLQKAVLPLPK